MEEKCGTTQQVNEETPLEGCNELLDGVSAGGGPLDSAMCMPICFLVREQAKSLLAIKDLQKRVHQVEGVQDDVVTAISEVHDYLAVTTESGSFRSSSSPRSSASKSPQGSEKSPGSDGAVPGSSVSALRSRLATLVSPSALEKNWDQQPLKEKNLEADLQALAPKFARGKDSAPESDKQDSGLDSDCREQGQESNPSQSDAHILYSAVVPTKNSDELLELLDEIGEKSEILRQHVSGVDESPNHCSHLSSEMAKLQLEQLDLRNLLCDIKDERDDLKTKLMNLEHTTCELAMEKKDLEQRFMYTLVEKHKLETKIQAIRPFSIRGSAGCTPRRDGRVVNDANLSNAERTPVYKVDSEAVSSVLKETSTVDLQKQVLTYMMENEVLRAKLDQICQQVTAKDMEKEFVERVLGEEAKQLAHENKQLAQENEQLRVSYNEQKMEIATLHSRVRMLENLLQSMTVENHELHMQLAEPYFRGRTQKSAFAPLLSSDSPGNYPAGRFSMPARHLNEPDVSVSCAKAKLLSNTSSYIDVTIEDKDRGDSALTLDPSGFVHRKSSTPLNPARKPEKPNFSELPSALGMSGDSQLGRERRPNKRLTFNSMKNLAASSKAAYPARERYLNRAVNSSCDKSLRRSSDPRALESIQEKNPDVRKFPFFTILQKLKANSDYKLSNGGSLEQLEEDDAAPSVLSSSLKPKSPTNNVPQRKTANDSSSAAEEPSETIPSRDKRAGSSKNIHRRIQNILDRITAESDTATTVPASMI